MIFKELHLLGFGKFHTKTLKFEPGLNLIFGKNEAGKSTLFKAFSGIIFGFKTERDRYRPWKHPAQYCARLLLETTTHAIQIERDFKEDMVSWIQEGLHSKEKSSFHERVSPIGRSSERDVYLKKIHTLFGFSEPDIFRHSLFIEQRSLHELPSLQTSTELKQLISHISEFKYDDIIKRLEERYFEITKKNPKGVDKRHDRLIENIQNQVRELEEKIKRAYQDEKRLCEIGKKASEIKEELFLKDQKLKKLSKSVEALLELGELSEKEAEIQKSLSEIKKKKILVEKLLSQKKEIEKDKPKLNRFLIGTLLLGIGSIPILFFSTEINWIWLILSWLALTILCIHHYMDYKKVLSYTKFKDIRLISQLEVLPPLEHIETQFAQLQKNLYEIESKKAEIEKNIYSVNWSSTLKNSESLQKLILDQETETEKLHEEVRHLETTQQLEKQNYVMLAKGLESPFTLEEDLYDLKDKEKNLQIKAQALLIAREMLRNIVIQFRKEHLNLFADQTKELFQKMASENYDTVLFDEMNFSPAVKTRESEGTPVSMTSLSCGTQDQLFFSMKLALLDQLSSSQKLPLFLDDPFVNFDHARRKKAIDLLYTLAKERQIFLFTYDPWYVELLGKEAHFINLEVMNETTI